MQEFYKLWHCHESRSEQLTGVCSKTKKLLSMTLGREWVKSTFGWISISFLLMSLMIFILLSFVFCFLSILIIDYIISTWGYAYLNKPAVYSAIPRHIFILLNQYGHPKNEPKFFKTSPIFLNSNQFNNCSFFLANDFITLFSCLALKSS